MQLNTPLIKVTKKLIKVTKKLALAFIAAGTMVFFYWLALKVSGFIYIKTTNWYPWCEWACPPAPWYAYIPIIVIFVVHILSLFFFWKRRSTIAWGLLGLLFLLLLFALFSIYISISQEVYLW
jgi:hypothetical protein